MPPSFCPSCGTKFKVSDTEFCPKCGVQIKQDIPSQVNRETSKIDTDGGKRTFIVPILIVVGIIVILVVGGMILSASSHPATTYSSPTPVPTPVPTLATPVPTPVPTKEIIVVVVNKSPAPTPVITTPRVVVVNTRTPLPTYVITFTPDLTIIPGTSATIPVGGSVTWVNADPYKEHTVVATDASDGAWFAGQTSVTIPAGKSLLVTFPYSGTFEYTTVYQPNLDGAIIVK